jgi:hypothetical protein
MLAQPKIPMRRREVEDAVMRKHFR